jgi:hypothetical protein
MSHRQRKRKTDAALGPMIVAAEYVGRHKRYDNPPTKEEWRDFRGFLDNLILGLTSPVKFGCGGSSCVASEYARRLCPCCVYDQDSDTFTCDKPEEEPCEAFPFQQG